MTDRISAAEIVAQALRELGKADAYEVHVFRGKSENDWRAELKPRQSGEQPFYVHMDGRTDIVALVDQVKAEIERNAR